MSPKTPSKRAAPAGADARRLAVEALERIDRDGAYANLVLPSMLERSALESRDRAFVTELVYGTTRMRRACDWLVDRFIPDPGRIDVNTRNWLRLGAFQLVFMGTPPHAAVGATVGAAPRKVSGLCNAVLRRVADSMPVEWPSDAVRLSQPDWILAQFVADLGATDAIGALEAMNESASVTMRTDGYIQDEGSSRVADAVEAGPGELILDVCAAPGGKATALAATGAHVIAADVRPSRVGLIAANAHRLGRGPSELSLVTADGMRPPFRAESFDRVLLDAPCSGLGSLRRRPDARWRIAPDDIESLALIQRMLLGAVLPLVRPGGMLVYSVCTLTQRETSAIDEWLADEHPEFAAVAPPSSPWRPLGRGALLLPQAAGTDGMFLLRLRRGADSRS